MLDSEIEEVHQRYPHLSDDFIAELAKESGKALFGAFNSGTWLLCPGSVQAGFNEPIKTTLKDIENDALKYWTGLVAVGKIDVDSDLSKMEYSGLLNGADVLVGLTPDMHNILSFNGAFIDSVVDENSDTINQFRIDISPFAPGGFDYIDAVSYSPENKMLTLFDADNRTDIKLSAEDSHKLVIGAIGAIDILAMKYEIDLVRVVILQAEIEHISEHIYTAEDLDSMSSNIPDLAHNALVVDPMFNPGVTQCEFCPIRAECKPRINWALMHALEDCTDIEEAPTFNHPEAENSKKITNENLSSVAHVLPSIAKFVNEAEASIIEKLSAGEDIPECKMIRGIAGRYWEDEDSVIEYLENVEGLDIDKFAPRKMLSVSDFEKAFPESDALGMYEKCKYGKDRLVSIDHPGDDLYRDQFDNLDEEGGEPIDLSFLE